MSVGHSSRREPMSAASDVPAGVAPPSALPSEREIDAALEDSFPCSDPPSWNTPCKREAPREKIVRRPKTLAS